ncbi:hypothetical protein DVH24_035074 [Malus domestica]|uniref:BTB domain-containing protein n=1 Tax=Malus domestica TaxID=3750 RepID=A0A498IK57_MALDO|nr:hypothetical protein DVH24_035074 [Malus domestica]
MVVEIESVITTGVPGETGGGNKVMMVWCWCYDKGGKKFCTTIDTLTRREPDSLLAAMFSGRHSLCQEAEKGYVFLDRDGKHFRHILNWLRDGVVPTLKDSEYSELLREAEYYQLLGLMDGIHAVLNKKREDEEVDTELTRTDIIKCIQSEKVRFRGVNLSGLDLSKLDLSFVDFSYACLKNVFFSRANLQCAKFKVSFSYTWMSMLRVPSFTMQLCGNACLIDSSFCQADLRSAHLQNADLTNANLEGAILEGANLKGAKLRNTNLKDANLQRAYLRQVNLRDTHLITVHETLEVLDQTAPCTLEMVSWEEAIRMGDQVSEQTTTFGMLWTEGDTGS